MASKCMKRSDSKHSVLPSCEAVLSRMETASIHCCWKSCLIITGDCDISNRSETVEMSATQPNRNVKRIFNYLPQHNNMVIVDDCENMRYSTHTAKLPEKEFLNDLRIVMIFSNCIWKPKQLMTKFGW
ncbi:unnamed protein product [Thelazia callipaeda]|uniref:DDE_Tnp_1_7 domain-containing protein n=1 Tax=Thelazia callipaeda TaxID=103827 RepID=A0A0N5D4I9_THECL|nr:unnamed protein product [Thelazia callipaeda]